VTPGDVEAGSYQGELAVLDSVEVTAVSGGTVTVTDGTDTTTVYVDSSTDIDAGATFTVGNFYTVTGVLSRYNSTFELKPRSSADIQDVTP
jgi:DNA/RNA endonuclease YhcR with UshA esterase domain